jgi:hypothetical protein
MPVPSIENAEAVAEIFESWCGPTPWSRAMREFGALGGLCQYWCGMPKCASSIPLTFALFMPDGAQFPCGNRLKDIRAAADALRAAQGTLYAKI